MRSFEMSLDNQGQPITVGAGLWHMESTFLGLKNISIYSIRHKSNII